MRRVVLEWPGSTAGRAKSCAPPTTVACPGVLVDRPFMVPFLDLGDGIERQVHELFGDVAAIGIVLVGDAVRIGWKHACEGARQTISGDDACSRTIERSREQALPGLSAVYGRLPGEVPGPIRVGPVVCVAVAAALWGNSAEPEGPYGGFTIPLIRSEDLV